MRFAIVALIVAFALPGQAHELHQNGQHVSYQSWINKEGKGCCDNRDCRPIEDRDVQLSPVTKVRIEGEWCTVLPQHYLKQGNAPDWGTNHVCVLNPGPGRPRDPCGRLLCFQPQPLF